MQKNKYTIKKACRMVKYISKFSDISPYDCIIMNHRYFIYDAILVFYTLILPTIKKHKNQHITLIIGTMPSILIEKIFSIILLFQRVKPNRITAIKANNVFSLCAIADAVKEKNHTVVALINPAQQETTNIFSVIDSKEDKICLLKIHCKNAYTSEKTFRFEDKNAFSGNVYGTLYLLYALFRNYGKVFFIDEVIPTSFSREALTDM